MEIPECFVGCGFSIPAIRRTAVIVDVAKFLDNRGKKTFIDVTSGETRLSEIRVFIVVIEFEFERFGNLVIWR